MSVREVVVVLPIVNNQVLLQLRDEKPGIDSPGCWGYFGGHIAPGETPLEAANRELLEEIGYCPSDLNYLGLEYIKDLNGLPAHRFYGELKTSPKNLNQREGMDMKLVSMQEIQDRKIFSVKKQAFYPVVPTYFIEQSFKMALDKGATYESREFENQI